MKLYTAVEELTHNADLSVFLAGGITNCPNWQKEVIEGLKDTDIVVFNPRRENFPIHDPNAADEQIRWEFEALERASIFSMYFADAESDQPICMYELGRNILRMQVRCPRTWEHRVIVTADPKYRRYKDVLVQTELATGGKITVFNSLEEHIEAIKRECYFFGNR